MNNLRLGLMISAIVVVAIAIIAYAIIMFKVFKKKQEIKKTQMMISEEIANKDSEIKMKNREDLGKPITELQDIISNSMSHEIVEFCINTCIRNNYKKILMIGDVGLYEAISISNKAEANITINKNNFDLEKYNEIKNKIEFLNHEINLADEKQIRSIKEYDAVLNLNSIGDFDKAFLDNESLLRNGGMFIFANVKSNKKSAKKLVEEIKHKGYRYDYINWYTNFITIVK